jgi:hypothetical protein
MFAAGPSLHVPAILYWRWGRRKGGMVDSWTTIPIDQLVADLKGNVEQCLQLIESCDVSSSEQTVMRFAVYLNQLGHLRAEEFRRGAAVLVDPGLVSPAFDFSAIPPDLNRQAPDIQQCITTAYVNLVRQETSHYWRRRDFRNALARLRTLRVADIAREVRSGVRRRYVRSVTPRQKPLALPADLQARLAQ